MKCKHQFHFVRIYFRNPFTEPFKEVRMASFICDKCGYLKVIPVKLKEND